MKHSIEKENLEAHVDLCAERYDSLLDKINRLEHRMSDMDMVVRDILDKLTKMEARQHYNWLKTAGFTIGLLLSIVGFLIVNFAL